VSRLFFSYSHADEALRDQLEKHLAALKHQGLISTWHDRRILAGQVFGEEIDEHLKSADVVLLLVTSDFLASDYCYKREMQQAMEQHADGTSVVIPVILRPCDWHDTPFGKLLAAPKDGRAITQWPNPDEAFLDVVKAIKNVLTRRTNKPAPAGPAATSRASVPASNPSPRSSNLRVAKKFTQLDKDEFLHEGFDYLSKYFANSLQELVARNPGLEQRFRRIDANRFTAAAYRGGQKVCACSVYLGGTTTGIAYTMDDNARSNSFNEALNVETDDQSIHFKSFGMQIPNGSRDKLGFEGAAEMLWSIFIRPIQ
jgi:TIR domain